MNRRTSRKFSVLIYSILGIKENWKLFLKRIFNLQGIVLEGKEDSAKIHQGIRKVTKIHIDYGKNITCCYLYQVSIKNQKYFWNLKACKSYQWSVEEIDYNKGDLEQYKEKVNQMKEKELEIVTSCISGIFTWLVNALYFNADVLGPKTTVTNLLQMGFLITVGYLLVQLYFIRKNAKYYFLRINHGEEQRVDSIL